MKNVENDLLKEITQRLVAELHPEKIILFGSHAWGTPDEDSDLDLLVIVTQSNTTPKGDFKGMLDYNKRLKEHSPNGLERG